MHMQNLWDGRTAFKKTWERNLSITLDDEEWDRICRNIKTMSRDVRVRLIQFKIMHRFYWTPSRLFRIGLKDTPNCWKCKTEDGQLLHVLWSCDKVQEFWTRIHETYVRLQGPRFHSTQDFLFWEMGQS